MRVSQDAPLRVLCQRRHEYPVPLRLSKDSFQTDMMISKALRLRVVLVNLLVRLLLYLRRMREVSVIL